MEQPQLAKYVFPVMVVINVLSRYASQKNQIEVSRIINIGRQVYKVFAKPP